MHRFSLLLVASNQFDYVLLLIRQFSQLFVRLFEAVLALMRLLLRLLAPRLLFDVEILQVGFKLLLVLVVDEAGEHLLDVELG